MRLGLGGESPGMVRIKAQRGLRGGEAVFRLARAGENEAAQNVVAGFVRFEGDGAVDGGERLALPLRLMEQAGGEVLQGKRVVGLLGESFAVGALGVGVATEVVELKAAHDLRGTAEGVAHGEIRNPKSEIRNKFERSES